MRDVLGTLRRLRLFRDSVDTTSCLSAVVDGRLAGILTIQTADREFKGAIRLYERLGYRPLGLGVAFLCGSLPDRQERGVWKSPSQEAVT